MTAVDTIPAEQPPPSTFAAAVELGAYRLAARYADRDRWHTHDPDAALLLEEMATAAALAMWLRRWAPLAVHQAICAGATVAQVAAATGVDAAQVRANWRRWADEQRRLFESTNGQLGLSAADVERVAEAFDAAGVGEAHARPRPRDRARRRL